MSIKAIHALYDDDEILVSAAKKLHAAGIRVKDVFTPFPVHGLPEALHVPRTRLAICSFIYGFIAMLLACLGTWYFMISDWPMDVGGKPNDTFYHNVPAFIPVIFEFTVFCAAHFMYWTLLIRSGLFPGVKPKNPDPRTTDDKFLVWIETSDVESVSKILKETGAIEVKVA